MSVGPAELCVASYVAQRVAGHIVIFAMGVHHETGGTVFFRREPGDSFPPRFSLWRTCSDTHGLHVLTPFSACTSFQTTRAVQQVTVVDAAGEHIVSLDC